MAISRIASGSAQATSASLSATPSVGDRIVDFAHRDGSNTAPSLASGFATIENGGSNTNGLRASSKASAGTETSTGTCANATSVGGVAYRGLDPQVPFGAIDQTGGTGTSLTFPSLTLQVGDGSSWVAACGAHRSATNVNANAPSLTLVSGVADFGINDSNGGVSSYAGGNQTVNASSGWRTAVVELVAQQSTAVPSQLIQSSATYSNLDTETGNDFICSLHAASGANNSIVVFVNYEAPAGGVTRALTISGIGGSVTATAVAGPVTGNGVITAGYLIEGVASGVTALRFHFTDNGSPVQVNSFHATYGEYSGVATSSALRAANANASAGGGAGPTLALQPGNLSVTAGDVVVVFALSNGWGASLRGATVTGWRAAPGYHLLHADRDIGIATMVGVASATGTINPAIYCADSATDTFACLAIVLKGSPGSGTPGASTRVLTSTHTYFAQAGTALMSAPINGDAQVILGAHGNGLVAITSANGSGAGAYTVNAPTGNRPQCVYAAGLTQDSTNLATLTLSPTNAGWQCVIYDLVGIDPTTPFDQVASANSTGSFTGPGDINTGSVTPTNPGAVVLTALRVTGGPIDSMSGPAGVVYDAPYYTGQTDSSVMDLGEGYAHVTNAPASSLTFLWHSASTPDWDWSAFVFNAAAGGGGAVTGTGSAALSPIAAAATGLVTFLAVGSVALSPLGVAGSGQEKFTCSGSAALSPLSVTCSGSETFSGGATAAALPVASSGSGAEAFAGSSSAALSSVACSGAGTAGSVVAGTCSCALSPIGSSGNGLEVVAGAGSAACSPVGGSGSGAETFAGPAAVVLAPLTTSSSGTEAFAGAGVASCSPVAPSSAGQEAFMGGATVACSPTSASGTGTTGNAFNGAASCALASLGVTGAGAEAFTGPASTSCGPLSASGAGSEEFAASGSAALQAVAPSGSGAEGQVVTGAGAAALSPVVPSGAATEVFAGAAGAQLSAVVCAAAGANVLAITGTATCALSPAGADGAGDIAGTVFGACSASVAPLSCAGVGNTWLPPAGPTRRASLRAHYRKAALSGHHRKAALMALDSIIASFELQPGKRTDFDFDARPWLTDDALLTSFALAQDTGDPVIYEAPIIVGGKDVKLWASRPSDAAPGVYRVAVDIADDQGRTARAYFQMRVR